MKISSRFFTTLLIAAASALVAPAQTITQVLRVEITNANSTPGIVDGDRFDIAFGLNFDAIDAQTDLANFQNSAGIVAPESINITRVGTNTGTWDPSGLTFFAAHLLASNTPSYDNLSFTFESNTPNVPAPGHTFNYLTLDFWTFTNLGLVQNAPATNSPFGSFLGGPAVNYSGFEQAYGFFGVNTGSVGFNVVSSAIPEPSTYAGLAGAAALGLAFWRRRSRRGIA